ncbi:MAG: hypothetical protein ACI8WB_004002 [Phenylobacterium sp.]|jgi:hypothetical protein
MNFGEIQSFLKGAPLFDADQARGPQGSGSQAKPNIHKLGGEAAIFQRSQADLLGFNVLNKVVTDKLQSLDIDAEAISKKNENLFDFNEVAKNVLSFVEKMMMKAKGGGADDQSLAGMMAKAREGIDEGFAQARKELGEMGEMNDGLSEGIDKSYQQIQDGLGRVDDRLFKPQDLSELSVSSAELNYSLSKSSSITIKTNDGDTVNIDFAEVLSYQNSQKNAAYSGFDDNGNAIDMSYSESSESRFHATGFSFSVEGELDDDEKAAIGALVQDVSKLAEEFFNGDLDKAFKQATQLGYDQSELSGFSLEMSRVEKVSVSQAYAQVAQYDNAPKRPPADQPEQNVNQLVKPVANYLQDLMAFLEQAREQLDSAKDLQDLVTQSVSKYLEFRDDMDISSGLERFAAFNQQMLGTLPGGAAPDAPAQGIAAGEPAPGRSAEAPGRSGDAPGRSGEAPGQNKTASDQAV